MWQYTGYYHLIALFLCHHLIFSNDFFRDTLMSIAKHYETGESLPEEVYLKLLAARTFRAGSQSLRQVCVFGCCYFFFPVIFCHLFVMYPLVIWCDFSIGSSFQLMFHIKWHVMFQFLFCVPITIWTIGSIVLS